MRQLYTSILNMRFALLLTISLSGNAQYYTIPDAGFASWLVTHYPTCMNGNQLDTTCSAVTSASTMIISNDLTFVSIDGIQFFDNLNSLVIAHTAVASLPNLPANLAQIDCHSNDSLTSFSSLPASLVYLECYSNQLTSLPSLPANLETLKCPFNLLTALPILPASLIDLECYSNQLTDLPSLPTGLLYLSCGNNPMQSLPSLPTSLLALDCSYSPMNSLPNLPANLTDLYCTGCQLTSLPSLPANLHVLKCGSNQLTSLPSIPNSLIDLICYSNQLTSLSYLPIGLNSFVCQDNQIQCFNGNLPQTEWGNISGNPCMCVPNQTSYTGGLPICFPNDPTNNPNNCYSTINSGIIGKITIDENTDCIIDLVEEGVSNIKINLYDTSDNFLSTTYSDSWGYYFFPENNGTYRIELDTVGQSYSTSCVINNTVTLQTIIANNANFSVDCDLPTDLGVMAIAPSGLVFPGETHSLYTYAGNMLANYPINCLDITGGTITITVSGPVVYEAIPVGALMPTQINGNTFVYEISDFSTFSYFDYFSQNFSVNNTAQLGELICVSASISSPLNDPNTLNNLLEFCYEIGNSFDPNKKEVYPNLVEPSYNDYLTYTIQFQNTGTAAAINIHLEDTLSTYLDVETFELLHGSHPVIPTLQGNNLKFQFNNIQLSDSTSNEPASHGFVQYRIKPVSGLPAGTVIPNTASIYFDYNDPIVTNTATTTFSALSINDLSEEIPVIYPNPSSGFYYVKSAESISDISVYNHTGEQILQQQNTQSTISIDLSNQPAGVYLLKTNNGNQMHYIRLVKL